MWANRAGDDDSEQDTDPAVAPRRILSRETRDQRAALSRERRPARASALAEGGPLAADQVPVPPQERLGSDGEHDPERPGHAPAQGGEDGPVARPPGRALDPTAQ